MVITLAKQGAAATRPPEDKGLSGAADEEMQRLTSSDEDDGDAESQRPNGHNNGSGRAGRRKRHKMKFNKRERWRRIVMNDLENIPIGLIILWVNPLCEANGIVTSICAISFVVCRILHTILYAYSLQPFRSIAFTIGVLSIFAASINLIIGSLNGKSGEN